jgi:photosystem I P700 chlorophyll a apoprotein A1
MYFLGFHSFGLYIHNDTMSALGRPQDMFSDTAIQLQPVFAQWIQNTHFLAPELTAPNALSATSLTWVVILLLLVVSCDDANLFRHI